TLKTDKSSYQITLGKNPDNESSAYLGAYLEQSTKINDDFKAKYGEFVPNALIWIYGLIVIMIVLNLGIGLFNLVPLGPLDGGRMLQLAMHKFFGVEKGNKYWYYIGMFFLAIIFINIAAGFGFLKLFR
ncbi:MAG TPA: site-2 protease family protein, partial [Candidatus Nanoarchaeia archaeon]|nr:site-2 protease family protein [Candidatus Nanoarchaeia archaeon]